MSYDLTGKSAGDRLYGPHQSRYVTVAESLLTHPAHDDGLVDKGDPVSVNDEALVGVALKSAEADTDEITIDTEGIFALMVTVTGYDAGPPVVPAMPVGDAIYFQDADGTLTNTFGQWFGWALSELMEDQTGLAAVKVHGSM